MNGFLYFLPKHVGEITDKDLTRFGIQYAIERHNMAGPRSVVLGPGSQAGLLIASKPFPIERLLYAADQQDWMEHPKVEGGAWIGKWSSDDIRPSDLQRDIMVEGESVTLENGTKWQAAYARKFECLESGDIQCFCPLPKGMVATKQGWQPTKIAKRYRNLSRLAEAYWTEMLEASRQAQTETFSWVSKFADDLAVAALTANYRVSDAELSLLDAYGHNARQALIRVAMDEATLFDWQKKRAEAGLDGIVLFGGLALSTMES